MKKALFLDRDGVINEDSGYVYRQEDFLFIDGIFDLCHTALNMGYLVVVITNQAGIARGIYSEDDFHKLNDWMVLEFQKRNIKISAVYFCPFHPDSGIGEFKQDSFDRKPNPGMFFKARDALGIDLSNSVFVGDKDSDMTAGLRAGIGKLFFLHGRYPFNNKNESIIVENLEEVTKCLA